MMEKFKNCFSLINLNTEKFTISIYTLRFESRMKSLLNFYTVRFLNSASKLALKGHRDSRSIELLHSFVYILLRCHTYFYKARHNRIG